MSARRVLLLGATGTIGQATLERLIGRGYEVVCALREPAAKNVQGLLALGAQIVDFEALDRELAGLEIGAVVSCMASRSGVPADAWAVDHAAHSRVLAAAKAAGVERFVLLSAICVQRPKLAFQQAKLAFERELIASGLSYAIVRPTAFFKSLSGQIARVQAGRPFLLFGDGTLTACAPIADEDLADFLVDCLERADRWNQILPIGGPGPAMTPRAQGEALFALLGRPPRFRSVPVALLDAIIAGLSLAARIAPAMAAKAELARIGRYYATESMLVFDPVSGRYDAEATPRTGTRTLVDHYRAVLAGEASADLGAHKVF